MKKGQDREEKFLFVPSLTQAAFLTVLAQQPQHQNEINEDFTIIIITITIIIN